MTTQDRIIRFIILTVAATMAVMAVWWLITLGFSLTKMM